MIITAVVLFATATASVHQSVAGLPFVSRLGIVLCFPTSILIAVAARENDRHTKKNLNSKASWYSPPTKNKREFFIKANFSP
jgi:hypothetical protein